MSIQVWQRALFRASGRWSDQADELYGARRNLDGIDTALLGARVGPVADAFVTTWATRVQALREDAEEHAEALSGSALMWFGTDDAAVENLQQLLPWDDRNLTPGS